MASKHLRNAGIDPERVLASALQAALGEDEPPTKRRHPGRVLAAGAAVAAAAAVGQKRMPRLVKVPLRMGLHRLEHKLGDAIHVDDLTGRVDDLAGSVRDRLAGHDGQPPDDELDDEPRDEEDLDEEDEVDDEPRDDGDEDEDADDEPGDDGGDEPEDDDGPRGGSDDAEPDEDESDEEDDEAASADDEPADEQEPDDEEGEEDEQIAARGLRIDDPDDSPDLFQALLAPRPRPEVMRRAAREFDPASRPPKPDRPKSRKSNSARA